LSPVSLKSIDEEDEEGRCFDGGVVGGDDEIRTALA